MNRNAPLSLDKLYFAGKFCDTKASVGANQFKFRKGVGSGDAVERSCGWEEEMREELRKDW